MEARHMFCEFSMWEVCFNPVWGAFPAASVVTSRGRIITSLQWMFKVSLPSTHSNISNFCIHFQASPSASDSLTRSLTSISASVCVCVWTGCFILQICIYKIQSHPALRIHGKETSSWENNLLYISKCKERKLNPFHYPATSPSSNSPVHTQRVMVKVRHHLYRTNFNLLRFTFKANVRFGSVRKQLSYHLTSNLCLTIMSHNCARRRRQTEECCIQPQNTRLSMIFTLFKHEHTKQQPAAVWGLCQQL